MYQCWSPLTSRYNAPLCADFCTLLFKFFELYFNYNSTFILLIRPWVHFNVRK